jgi:hypothetical protein
MLNLLSVIIYRKSVNGFQSSAIRYQEQAESAGFHASAPWSAAARRRFSGVKFTSQTIRVTAIAELSKAGAKLPHSKNGTALPEFVARSGANHQSQVTNHGLYSFAASSLIRSRTRQE